MLLLSRRIDFFTLFATFCGIAFIGETDGDEEALLDTDTDGGVDPLVDEVDE